MRPIPYRSMVACKAWGIAVLLVVASFQTDSLSTGSAEAGGKLEIIVKNCRKPLILRATLLDQCGIRSELQRGYASVRIRPGCSAETMSHASHSPRESVAAWLSSVSPRLDVLDQFCLRIFELLMQSNSQGTGRDLRLNIVQIISQDCQCLG